MFANSEELERSGSEKRAHNYKKQDMAQSQETRKRLRQSVVYAVTQNSYKLDGSLQEKDHITNKMWLNIKID